MSKSKTLKQLYDLTKDIWRNPELYTEKDIAIEWLEIAWVQEIADELIEQNICIKCGGDLRLDRNNDKAALRCYSCDTKY